MPSHASHAEREWRALPLVTRADSALDTDIDTQQQQQLCIDADALAALQTVQARNVHVLGVCGPPRTGKRLFLHTLLRAVSCDFTASPPGCRVLLWLWLPVTLAADTVDSVQLVISSGAQAGDTETDRTQRLALLLLLSSALVYTDDGEINAQAIERLDWLTGIHDVLRIKANQDAASVERDFRQHAPKFIWLIQNVKVKWLTAADGTKLTPLQYLERSLVDEPGYSDAVAVRNRLRMLLLLYFDARDCVALSRPVESVGTSLADVAPSTGIDALRSAFVTSVDAFYASFVASTASSSTKAAVPAKHVMGVAVTAPQFIDVLQNYVDALNAKQLPTIATASTAMLEQSIADAFAHATHIYNNSVGRNEKSQQLLQIAHYRGEQAATATLRAFQATLPASVATKTLDMKNREHAWRKQLTQQHAERIAEYTNLTQAANDKLLTTLVRPPLHALTNDMTLPRGAATFSDSLTTQLTQLKTDFEAATRAFVTEASGDANDAHTALVTALLDDVLRSLAQFGSSVVNYGTQQLLALKDACAELTHAIDAAAVEATYAQTASADQQRQSDAQIAAATQQLSTLRSTLRGDSSAARATLAHVTSAFDLMQRKHDVRVAAATSDIEWTRSRTAELDARAAAAAAAAADSTNSVAAAMRDALATQRSLYSDETALRTQQRELMDRVATLVRQLAQKKQQHARDVFAREQAVAQAIDDQTVALAAFASELATQAKRDSGALKLAYADTRSRVQQQLDAVKRDRDVLQEQLTQLLSPLSTPRQVPAANAGAGDGKKVKATGENRAFFAAMTLPMPAVPVLLPPSPRAADDATAATTTQSSVSPRRAATFRDVTTSGATFGSNAATTTTRTRTDSALCKQS